MSDDSAIDSEKLFQVAAAYAQADPKQMKIFMAYFHQEMKKIAEKKGVPLGFDMDVLHRAYTAAMLELAEKFAPAEGEGNSETLARLRRTLLFQQNVQASFCPAP
jgi:hypothetical protein